MKTTIDRCKDWVDVSFKVADLAGDEFLLERLREIGIHPGATLKIVQRLPLRGPHIIRLGEVDVALREEEARCVWIQS